MLDPLSDEAFFQAAAIDAQKGDRMLRVRFFYEDFEDPKLSAAEGRPMFRSEEMCEIRYGDKDNIVCDRVRYMRPDPRRRFAPQYARFKAGEKVQTDGTPLVEFGLIPRTRAKEYLAIDIHTVEELANLTDTRAQEIRGALPDRQKARDFLEMARGQAPITKARAEIAALRAQVEALRAQVSGTADEPPRRKPGRPRKNPEPETQE